MDAKPILFSAPMVRALLAGRKTQTRRIITRLRGHGFGKITEFGRSDTKGYDWHFRDKRACWNDLRDAELREALPHQPGDLLWVREAMKYDEEDYLCYAADMSRIMVEPPPSYKITRNSMPSMFMPRWASRITLEVGAVKVERLQDISEEDAKAEGVYRVDPTPEEIARGDCTADDFVWMAPGTRQDFGPRKDAEKWGPDPVFAFRCVWESIHGPDGWKANPWVTAITFRALDHKDTPAHG